MAFDHNEFRNTSFLNKRKSSRNHVQIIANLVVSSGERFKVTVLDLSQTGFRIETGNLIAQNSKVYLGMPTFESLQARIAWCDRNLYGCQFTQPLHQSIFEHIARTHPTLVA